MYIYIYIDIQIYRYICFIYMCILRRKGGSMHLERICGIPAHSPFKRLHFELQTLSERAPARERDSRKGGGGETAGREEGERQQEGRGGEREGNRNRERVWGEKGKPARACPRERGRARETAEEEEG